MKVEDYSIGLKFRLSTVKVLGLNCNRTRDKEPFCEEVGNEMLKMFLDSFNPVLSETAMHRLSVYGKHEVVVYVI